MRTFQVLIGLLLVIGNTVAARHTLGRTSEQATSRAAGASSQASAGTLPKDIHPDTGNRFPAVKREELNEAGKKLYDTRGVADAFGPGAIRVYSPPLAAGLIALLGKTPAFDGLTGGAFLSVRITAGAFLWAFGGALLAYLTLLWPAYKATRQKNVPIFVKTENNEVSVANFLRS